LFMPPMSPGGGLHEHGYANFPSITAFTASGSFSHCQRCTATRHHGMPALAKALGHVLIHGDGGAEYARAHIREPASSSMPESCRLRQTCRASRGKSRRGAVLRRRSSGTSAASVGSAVSITRRPPSGCPAAFWRRLRRQPVAVLGNADGHGLVFVQVESADHAGGGGQRTSCSPERPPKSTPTRSRFFQGHKSFLFRWAGKRLIGLTVIYKCKRGKRGKRVAPALRKRQPLSLSRVRARAAPPPL